jgi:hypothetical protein
MRSGFCRGRVTGTEMLTQETSCSLNAVMDISLLETNWITIVVKSSNFWEITPCSPLKDDRRFGGIYRLHLQGQRISRAKSQSESKWQAEQSACLNFGLCRKQERNGRAELGFCWFARRTEWNRQHSLALTRTPTEPIGDKKRIAGWSLKGAILLV